MTICHTCKTEIRPGEEVTIIHWHEGDERLHRDCITTLKQRIAELEARVAELMARQIATGAAVLPPNATVKKTTVRWYDLNERAEYEVTFTPDEEE